MDHALERLIFEPGAPLVTGAEDRHPAFTTAWTSIKCFTPPGLAAEVDRPGCAPRRPVRLAPATAVAAPRHFVVLVQPPDLKNRRTGSQKS